MLIQGDEKEGCEKGDVKEVVKKVSIKRGIL